jgi:immunoglobulin-binding protein 1
VTVTSSGDDLDLIASLLPPPNTPEEQQQAEDEDDELRHICLLVIRLTWAQAQSQLESLEQELELLLNAPPVEPEPRDPRDQGDISWRLDPSIPRGGPDGKGPLMDSSGRVSLPISSRAWWRTNSVCVKPLRPFTILPGSTSSERSRMQAEVFRPDHRLPTMTMDDYLEEEERRGNVITGGG